MTHPLLVWLEEQLAELDETARREGRPGRDWERIVGYADSTLVQMMPPTAVLALVEAHRSLLAIHSPAVHQAERYGRPHGEPHQYCSTCIGGTPCECCPVDHPDNQWPCPTVRALASAYRHHPGYLPEWAPQ